MRSLLSAALLSCPTGGLLPLPKRVLLRGGLAQVNIFGEGMRGFSKSGGDTNGFVNAWLSDNRYEDYYTRRGLNDCRREMITFCFLAAQGGCEPQLLAHITVNLRTGNSCSFLRNNISQCLPYIGYPRTLNALCCVNEAVEPKK